MSESNKLVPTKVEIEKWLRSNTAMSVQPYTAFIEAFDKSGKDLLELRIAKANRELEWQWKSWSTASEDVRSAPATKHSKSQATFDRWYSNLGELSYLGLLTVWGRIADFGYRPLKALPIIPIAMVLFASYFWWWLGIVGYQAREKRRVSPIGILFYIRPADPSLQYSQRSL